MTEEALVTAVGETRGEFPQIAFADWLAAQRAPSLWTGPPAIHQDEFHMPPPLEEAPSLDDDLATHPQASQSYRGKRS